MEWCGPLMWPDRDMVDVCSRFSVYLCGRWKWSAVAKFLHLGSCSMRFGQPGDTGNNILFHCCTCIQRAAVGFTDNGSTVALPPCTRCCQCNMETSSSAAEHIPLQGLYPKNASVGSPTFLDTIPLVGHAYAISRLSPCG